MPTSHIHPLAGQPAPRSSLVDVAALLAAYHDDVPDPAAPSQRVAFGTSGHRGSSLDRSFNEVHVLAIAQAICDCRKSRGTTGPLFLGMDTHALSAPACASALEVLAANGVDVMLAVHDEFTPTPAVSHAILAHNRGHGAGQADGIVVTPSHNPPRDGGIKYNPPHGGGAEQAVTDWIGSAANRHIEQGLAGVKRMPHARALLAATTHRHDYLNTYVEGLGDVVDMNLIRNAKLRLAVDPMGGAGVHYWPAIAARYGLDLTVTNSAVDPAFGFMPLDWDGRIRMDPSSPHAMAALVALRDSFDLAFACDTDHDRHGIVTPAAGLLPANHYLAVAIDYLLQNRPGWPRSAAIGKTVVSTMLIDHVAQRLGRKVYEVPVGFKWFAGGLLDGSLAVCAEESAGAAFLRGNGDAWTTDKDGITAALLSAEITARMGRDPGVLYAELAAPLGQLVADRVEAPATAAQKARLAALSAHDVVRTELAGEEIVSVLDHAPGNGAPLGGIKVTTASGWFAARPSGTEDIYKIYAESTAGPAHLQRLLQEAQALVDGALAGEGLAPGRATHA
ncbi:MAG: alpha-D-glucose phosphate-specific phosphoglucomutase [Burkholderiaceae bacterium]|nr:alpha-D-glucose phosphate-specific phosphoglucomutase [Burkholderiaceae bacterium]